MKILRPVLWFGILSVFVVGCQVVDAGTTDTTQPNFPSPTVFVATSDISPTVIITISASIPDVEPSLLPMTPIPSLTAIPFVCPNLYGFTEANTFSSEAMKEEVEYLVHLPPCYDIYEASTFPVLYLFHGWPLDEQHWLSLGVDVLVDDWVTRGLAGPFIVVLPGVSKDGRYVNSSGGEHSFEGMIVNELVPLIDQSYRTWRSPQGRAVGGISRGAVWSLEIGMRHQDVFSIVGTHSPALALNHPVVNYDPFVLARGDISNLRFYLSAGDKDWARASTIRFRDLLEEVGADVTYQVHNGSHVDDLWRGGLGDYVAFYTLEWPASFDALPVYISE